MTSNRRGLASHLVVGALATLAGAGITWVVTARPRLDPVTTHGEWVYIKKPAGDSVRAYVAYPERKDNAPAMIVIHEIFGLTDWEPTVGDRLAAKGFVAIVPDMLSSRWGISPPSPDSGRKLMAQLTPDGITADLDAAYGYVSTLPSVKKDKVGVMGFCWGGGQTFRYTTNNPKLKAAVVCYGPNPDTTTLNRIKAPILGVYGENDNRINSMLPTVGRIMKDLGKPFAADSYPGTGHGFLKPGRKGSDTDQVERAWANIEKFLHDKLGK
jgi:carboxymethylenebutenolidase